MLVCCFGDYTKVTKLWHAAMNLSDFHYDHCPPEYSNRSSFRDGHGNFSVSAVISSSCVVLEGLRDNSNCLSSVLPVGQDGQGFFPSEFHSSLPTSLLAGDITMFPNNTDRYSVSNSLDCPSVGLSYGNHFFESAATEFTTPGDELGARSDTAHMNSSFLTEDEPDGTMIIRPHIGGAFTNDSSENDIHPVGAVFNRGHSLVGSDGFDFYSPERCGDNELSTNCRFGVAASSTFHPSNIHVDQNTKSTCQYALLSTSPAYLEHNNSSFAGVDEKVDKYREDTVDYSTNDTCIQSQSPPPSKPSIKMTHFQDDEMAAHSEMNTLQKCLNCPPHSNTTCYSPHSSNKPKSLVSITMNTSFIPLSSEASGNVCGSLPNNDCVFTDSYTQMRLQFPRGNDHKRNTSESNEEEKYTSDESLGSTIRYQSTGGHKYTHESDVEFSSKRHYIDQKFQNTECLYAERPESVQGNREFGASQNCLNYDDAEGNINDVDNRAAETSNIIVSSCKTKRKHAETVESLQHHLETLDDRRKKMALSCSYLNLLRQRGQGAEEKSGEEQTVTTVVDVDHMMCSGVTVAGFKPRAIIRKRSKTATPTDVKDTEYWQKRRKNNDSARKSRESKKEKEKNFYKRALELEYENIYLQECLSRAETELATLGHPFVPPVFGGQYYY